MFFINASQWHCVEEKRFVTYSSLRGWPEQWPTEGSYYPFAWLRIDKKTQEILAARDHFGQEPFYYAILNETLIFGSTIPNILQHFKKRPAFTEHLERDCFLRDSQQDLPLVTETYYQDIYRVRPGCHLIIKPHGLPEQISFWSLRNHHTSLYYSDERDYLVHFTELLHEAVDKTTHGVRSLAAEFSGGVDSSMIFNACRSMDLNPTLYTQEIPPNYRITDEKRNVDLILVRHHQEICHHYVNANHFEPLVIFEQMAALFASPPPYIVSVLACNLYQSIANSGHDILLSGAGGDDLVSHDFPPQLAFPQLWREKKWRGIWNDCKQLASFKEKMRHAIHRIGYSHIDVHAICAHIERSYNRLSQKKTRLFRPEFYTSFSEYEYGNMQGDLSHNMLMRVEYEAVIAKSMGFRFAYPLLYPPLIEFCFRLPLEQKLRLKTTRWLARQYLSKNIPGIQFRTKWGSLAPNTMQKCRDYSQQGKFENFFKNLPFAELIDKTSLPESKLLLQINAYMLKCVERQAMCGHDVQVD